ncbi:membrane protein insertase YidC [Alistipes finegoldii]|uniref:Membrane protein insertase YidC n=3 Tax=Alistipes finegoldii TaxID=214856 RepID=A0AA37KMT2_9BACT|nr:membrane protein insertase YidC [Alistipes finegoldii]BDF65341.1 membrane protein insertase YidC [Alistipes finegoldii]GKI18840.1 membrane protein insertase YidC [Alistipes finegoldii]
MDKKTILGIVVVAVLFLGFAYVNTKQQEKYQQEMAAWQAYQDSVAAASRPAVPAADSAAGGAAESAVAASGETAAPEAEADLAQTVRQRRIAAMGEYLTAAQEAEPEEFTVENEVMTVRFSTRGGQITGVTLKDYTKYAPRGQRDQLIELMDPASARFDMSFYVKNGLNNVKVNTMDYVFRAEPVETAGDARRVTMRLAVAENAWLEYEYLIYNKQAPERDYLVDFNVRLVNMAPQMANQTSIGIDWSNVSYQNEKGFQNENMYTTLAYRFPGESSIEELGMSDGAKSKSVSTAVNWVAFKQQFFSSVFIAPQNVSSANMAFDTAAPGSELLKSFSVQMAVPYSAQVEGYDFAFYFGPNKYAILKKVTDNNGADLHMERLIPLGWGIFGWVNRWCVIPVFDFLRNYIGSFGIIILILVILVKLVISPLTYKSYVSMAKMRLIKPQVDELNKKYPKKEDAMKKQQATMELYKKAGINPMGGCIPMLIQLPILIAMFRFFPASIELREQPFLWADDLSSYDSIVNLPFSIPFYGDHVSLFALLMAVSLFGYSYFNYQQTASSQPQMAGMKFMMVYMMPIMMLLWFNSYSSGLCYYYLLSNLFTIGQTLVIRRIVDDEKIHAVMQANAARKSKGKKSKFQQRYEELMRQQEAQQRAKRK